MHAVCEDLSSSSSSLSLGDEVGERSVVHKANERQLHPFLGKVYLRRSRQPNPKVGARGRMLISADLVLSPSFSLPASLCLSLLFILG
jgi:hypothetical protein